MNVFAKFDEIPSMILKVIKETKRYGHMVGRTVDRTIGQRENSIPSHTVCGGIINEIFRFKITKTIVGILKWHFICRMKEFYE